ncbi:hypothetical protein GCM10010232_35190 [Streptomyces amakusaensis]|uniref:Integral membrane protein n=1 Tax=Streptomyces amakusaensis TaxID=67271 RepID=A0ABW0AFR3_9ACTN
MTWWLKARRIHPTLTYGVGAFVLLTVLLQDMSLVLPALSLSGGNMTALSLFTPVIVVGAIAQTLENRLPEAEESGIRSIRSLDSALILSTLGTVTVATLIGGWTTDSENAMQAGRDVCFLTGLMLVARFFIGRSGVILPLAWIFAVVLAGRETGTKYHDWAVTALPIDTLHAAVAAVASLGLGIALTHRTRIPL